MIELAEDLLRSSARTDVLVQTRERIRGVGIAVQSARLGQNLIEALVVRTDETDRVRVQNDLFVVEVGSVPDLLPEPFRSGAQLIEAVELLRPLLCRQIGVGSREVHDHDVFVEVVIDTVDDQRIVRAAQLGAVGEDVLDLRGGQQTADGAARGHPHVDVLPVPFVVVAAVVGRVEEVVLQHELEAEAALEIRFHLVDVRVDIDRQVVLVLVLQTLGELLLVLVLPALGTLTRKIEEQDLEPVDVVLHRETALKLALRLVGIELIQQREQLAVVDGRGVADQ